MLSAFAEWAIVAAMAVSAFSIYHILKEIAQQLAYIRLACAGIDARGHIAAEDKAREALTARE
jgi:hypothetical protein